MDECTHDCSSCSSNCESRESPPDLRAPMNPDSKIKNVVAVVSGKGGVGKSLVTALLACRMQERTKRSAVLDADVTGPSAPRLFGLEDHLAEANERGLLPLSAADGVKVMSINLLLPDKTSPVIWRGPVVSGVVRQFWSDVVWGEVDWMFVDMPPGTGDVPLTVFQSLPVRGIVIVTSPQELVGMIVETAVNMAEMMKVPVLGVVENMSYFECPDCGKQHAIFGESHVGAIAAKHGITNIARIPIDPAVSAACDAGEIASVKTPWLEDFCEKLVSDAHMEP